MSNIPPYELGKPLKQSYLPENYDYEANDTRNRFKEQKNTIVSKATSTEARIVDMTHNMTDNSAPLPYPMTIARNSA